MMMLMMMMMMMMMMTVVVTHCNALVADDSREATPHVSLVLTMRAILCLLSDHSAVTDRSRFVILSV